MEVSPTTELLHAELLNASSTGTKHKYYRIILLNQKAGILKLQDMISLITEAHQPDYRCVSYFHIGCFHIILPCASCSPSVLFFEKKMSGLSFCHSFINMKVRTKIKLAVSCVAYSNLGPKVPVPMEVPACAIC
jgi:hypothetical protein